MNPSAPPDTVPATRARPRILLLATGGTIAGIGADAAQTLSYKAGSLGVEQLLAAVPMLGDVAAIEAEQLANIDSKDADAALWAALANRVDAALARADIDGVVITHGTDTLEEAAYWLHLTIGSSKPVVLTAAMRPATALSADGPANLYGAVTLAAAPAAHGKGVLVTLGQRIHCARDVTKASTYALDAFASPEMGLLGWVQDGQARFERSSCRRHTVSSEFALQGAPAPQLPAVDIIVSHALASRTVVDAVVASGVRGIVVAGTGNGTIHAVLEAALRDAARAGVAVVRASRSGAGPVADGAAPGAGLPLEQTPDFVAAGSLNPYKARVLLMLALAAGHTEAGHLQRIFDQY